MQSFREIIKNVVGDRTLAGLTVVVTDREKIIAAENFGVANVEMPHVPVTENSLYRIASITKVVTGLTMMRLVEEGVLDLDAPVKDSIPWLTLKNDEAASTVTLRHLLSHTSGLEAEYTPEGARDESELEASLKLGLPSAEIFSLPSENKYRYSNWGIRLASLVAEVKTGEKFSELAKKYVIEPLNMSSTTFDIRDAITRHVSLPHTVDEEGDLNVVHHMKENYARLAAGGLYSNAVDLAKLARMLLSEGKNDKGETVISAETLLEMQRKHADTGEGVYYGLTMRTDLRGRVAMRGHLGSAPPYATSMFVSDELGLGVITLMNTEYKELREQIPQAIFESFM
jgi:CubicO group peptidase (beta-lactamase class C family)